TAITQFVDKANSTIVLVARTNPSVWGQSAMFDVTLIGSGPGNPSGLVIFSDGGTNIGQGTLSTNGGTTTASFSTSSLAVAKHSITASYGGDSNLSSCSVTLTQTVRPATTITLLVSSAN